MWQTWTWVGSIQGLGWVGSKKFNVSVGWVGFDVIILLYYALYKNHRLKRTITLHQQSMVHGHTVSWIVISLNQTSYSGCKRDRGEKTSCHETACGFGNNYCTVFDLHTQHV